MDTPVARIATPLREAGETHHVVYRIVDGDDADWASWYADWLIDLSELPQILGRPATPELGAEDAARRLVPLRRCARDAQVHLHIDMESVDTLETTMHLVLDLLPDPEFRSVDRRVW